MPAKRSAKTGRFTKGTKTDTLHHSWGRMLALQKAGRPHVNWSMVQDEEDQRRAQRAKDKKRR